jgi:hypothetical protein
MYKLLSASLSNLWRITRPAKIDIRMMRRTMQRPLARLATTILPSPQAQGDTPRAVMHTDGRGLATLIPSSGAAGWIAMVSGAFLISICFLAGFIAADAWMSRQPISLQSICSNMLALYKSRDEITDNEKWQQELRRLNDDCAIALHKYELTSTR